MQAYQNRKVLIVDDDKGIAFSITRILKRLGMDVVCCTTASEAVELIRKGASYSLFIVDIQMPEIKGTDLISDYIRISCPSALVLPMTGMLDEKLQAALSRMGCNIILEKPFTKDEFLGTVNKLLKE